MSKTTVFLLFSIGLLLVLVITNPKEQAHKDAVRSKVNSVFQKNLQEKEADGGLEELGKGLGFLFGGLFIDKLVDNFVTCDNYFIFSLTKVTIKEQTRTIGFGVLGNVLISSEIDKALKDFTDKEDEKEDVVTEMEKYGASEEDIDKAVDEVEDPTIRTWNIGDEIEFTGLLSEDSFYGPPGFGSTPEQDSREYALIVHLDEQFYLRDTEYDEKRKIDRVGLSYQKNSFDYDNLIGKSVIATATMAFALTGHDHAPAMTINISSIKVKDE